MNQALVKAAREEARSITWRRPSSGPGARSKSADTRLKLDPLPQQAQPQPQVVPPPKKAWPSFSAPPSAGGSTQSTAGIAEASGQTFAGALVGESVAPSLAEDGLLLRATAAGPATPASAALETRRSPLLRRRLKVSRSPSDVNESGGPNEAGTGVADALGAEWSGSAGGEEDCDAAEFSEYDEPDDRCSTGSASGSNGRLGSYCCSDRSRCSHSSGDGSSSAERPVEAELAQVEADLAAKAELLRDLEARQEKLRSRMDSSVRNANQLLATVGRLEARIVEAANEATASHRTPRAGDVGRLTFASAWAAGEHASLHASPAASQRPRLEDLVGEWTKFPLGLPEAPPVETRLASDASAAQKARQLTAGESSSPPAGDEDEERRLRFRVAMGMV